MNYYNEFDPFCAQWLRNLIAAHLIPDGFVDERDIREVRPDDLTPYAQCHFFAGIAGWPLALQLATWPASRPIWTGSCPCQPFSCAGKRKGAADSRHLWPEFFRLIKECHPPVVCGEQVASSEIVGTEFEASFIIAVQNGNYARANKLAKQLTQSHSFHWWVRWVDRVQADLAGIGYAFGFKVLGAHSVGAPHIRQRLYWVAHPQGNGRDQGRTEPDGRNAGAGCNAVRLADADKDASGRTPGEFCSAQETVMWQGIKGLPDRSPTCCDISNRLAHDDDARPQGRPPMPQCPGQCSAWEGSMVSRVGDTASNNEQWDTQPTMHGQGVTTGGSGWFEFLTIPCRDGKVRRISAEPGDVPLADGIPLDLGRRLPELARVVKSARGNHVGRLKGYGNALCVPSAAKFIRACMELLS
jgi:DNA (cytosine-5)-methyltransferase 1